MLIEPVEIAPGVWVFRSADAHHSSGVIVLGEGAALVNPYAIPGGLERLSRFVLEAGLPIQVVVLTHPTVAPPDSRPLPPSATVIAPGYYPERTAIDSIPNWEAVPLGADMRGLGLYNMRYSLLFCGDILSDTGVPSLAGGSAPYLEALDSLEALHVKIAVPSRGSAAEGKAAIRQRLQNDRNYVNALRRHVMASKAAGVPKERVVAVARDIYEGYSFVEDHLRNVRAVWEEMFIS